MVFSSVHLISLLAALAVTAAVGVSAARKVKNAADFSVGGHRSGAAMVSGTIVGTIIGGASTVGTAQLAFSIGLSAWWFTLGAGIAICVMGMFYAVPLRESKLQTIPQFLSLHYGPRAGMIAGAAASLGIFFSIVANILSATPLVSAIFQTGPAPAMAFVIGLTVCYVLFGGVWATGRVGILKTILIYIALLAAGLVTYVKMGGWTGFTAAFPAYPWFSLVGRGWSIDLASGLSLVVGTLTTQTYIQALFSARDAETARRGSFIAALITLPSGIPAVMVGMFMRTYHPDMAPIDALPVFVLTYLPPWLGGLAIAGLLLASIGSAAGLALGVGTMLTRDFFPYLRLEFCRRHSLATNRLTVMAVMLSAAVVTSGNLSSLILDWNFLSMGLRGAGIFLPFSLAVFCPGRISPPAAVTSMALGTVVAFAWKFFVPAGLDPLYAGMATSACVLAIFQIKKLIMPK